MEMKRRLFALGLAAALCLSLLSGCGAKSSTPSGTGSSGNNSAGGKVYYLNFKPEQDAQWQELADLYTKETGVEVTVFTAASGNYETTLMNHSHLLQRLKAKPGLSVCPWKSCLRLRKCWKFQSPNCLKTKKSHGET